MKLDELVRFYESLTPAGIARFGDFYTADACFKDPFNEVSGLAAIQRIFTHMFAQVAMPRFVVTEQLAAGNSALLVWEFHFRAGLGGRVRDQVLRGVSHLHFADDGRIEYHRDYWDAAEEVYTKLPGIGLLMRGLKRLFAA